MVNQLLVEQALNLGTQDRRDLANALWESLEDDDFPLESETEELLRNRIEQGRAAPANDRTLADVLAAWHAKPR